MTPDWPIFGRDGEGVAWRPDPATVADTRLARFLRSTGEPTLDALQARAVADPGWFWGAAADDIAIAWTRPPRAVLDPAGGPAWARWWTGGSFDWSWAAVEPRAARDPEGVAVTWVGEDGPVRNLSNAELAAAVRRAARQLRSMGVGAGDRVGILLPMLPETVVAVLAVSRLGAHLHADLLRVRGARHRCATCRLRSQAADHRRRVPAAWRMGRSQVRGGCRGCCGADRGTRACGAAGGR